MKAQIDERIKKELDFFADLAVKSARNPELGEQEFATSALLVEALRERGFDVEYPYRGMPTAFRAVKKRGAGPVVTFMAEYDALPEIGHACGHNLSGVTSVLAGVALAEAMDAGGIAGELRVLGTPAEETNGAKVRMADEGEFDDVSLAMMAHAGAGPLAKPAYRSLAIVAIEFSFTGKAAHAATAPWEGRSALAGLNLMTHAIDIMRQYVRPETRMHGVVTKGGEAANIVPEFAQASFYFRSPSRNYLETVLERAFNAAKGAALATDTQVSYRRHEQPFHELLPNKSLEQATFDALTEIGVAADLELHQGGSTDAGNVSWCCPTMHLVMPFSEKRIPLHTTEFAAVAADRSLAGPGISKGARVLARMGLAALTDEKMRAAWRRDWQQEKEK